MIQGVLHHPGIQFQFHSFFQSVGLAALVTGFLHHAKDPVVSLDVVVGAVDVLPGEEDDHLVEFLFGQLLHRLVGGVAPGLQALDLDEQRLALEQQMVENLLADDQQKRALWKMRSKPSKELIAVEEELAQVERRQDRSAKVMSVLPVVTESSHRTAVEELRRVSAEYRQIDGMLKNNLSGSLKREKKIIPHPELLEVEQKLNRLETMFPVKAGIKIKTTPSPVPQSEAPAERKEVINRELETVTKALAAGERKPGSLLSKLFPHRKTREEKNGDKEAFRKVLKISAKIERGSSRPSNELVEIERKLAVVDKVPWKPVKIRETIPPPNRMETERNQPHIVQEKKEMGEVLDRGKKRREQKPSKELVDLEQKLAKLKKEMR